MTSTKFELTRYDSSPNMVFDWKEPRYHEEPVDMKNPDGEKITVQDHLYAVTLFIGGTDSIDNYIEVDRPVEESTDKPVTTEE